MIIAVVVGVLVLVLDALQDPGNVLQIGRGEGAGVARQLNGRRA